VKSFTNSIKVAIAVGVSFEKKVFFSAMTHGAFTAMHKHLVVKKN
jgi:hypothetical protein